MRKYANTRLNQDQPEVDQESTAAANVQLIVPCTGSQTQLALLSNRYASCVTCCSCGAFQAACSTA